MLSFSKRFGWSLAAALAAAFPAGAAEFVERPGYLEFSGEMIVRPLPLEAALEQTADDLDAARELRRIARERLAATALRYHADTDEFIVPVPAGSDENRFAAELMATGRYEYAHPNWICFTQQVTPNDPRFGEQWHHGVMQSTRAWAMTTGSTAVVVGIVDTGVQLTHPDLQASLLPGYNGATNQTQSAGGLVDDQNGHGTHVAGCAAAIGNNGVGVAGAGWNFRILPVRVTSSGTGGSTAMDFILRGARWASDNGARVVGASWSGVSASAVNTTGNYIRDRNALFLYAAGNDGANLSGFDWTNVTVVGASGSTDARASFSAFGRAIDVFAPGVDILSTVRGSGYGTASGTSMATPVAAGVAALIMAAAPTLTAAQVEALLRRGSRDIGTLGEDDTFGFGRVGPAASVALARTHTRPRDPATGRVYEFVPAPALTWNQARSEAELRSHQGVAGRLAETYTTSEMAFITSAFGAANLNEVWIGGDQPAGSAEPGTGWRWASGAPMAATFWLAGQPNNLNNNENWLYLVTSGSQVLWADAAINRPSLRGFLVEYPMPVSVRLAVERPGWSGGSSPMAVEVRHAVTGQVLQTTSATVDASGTASFATSVQWPFRVSLRGDRWLRRTLNAPALAADGGIDLPVGLIPGDLDGDNAVTVFDYDRLSAAFDTVQGGAGFDPLADLDGDGAVTVFDYDLLSQHFDRNGDQ